MLLRALPLLLGLSATAQEVPPEAPDDAIELAKPEAWQTPGWGWGALPAVNYNSDEGFGFGALGSYYKYDGETTTSTTARRSPTSGQRPCSCS